MDLNMKLYTWVVIKYFWTVLFFILNTLSDYSMLSPQSLLVALQPNPAIMTLLKAYVKALVWNSNKSVCNFS
jgi:hypothetical protein